MIYYLQIKICNSFYGFLLREDRPLRIVLTHSNVNLTEIRQEKSLAQVCMITVSIRQGTDEKHFVSQPVKNKGLLCDRQWHQDPSNTDIITVTSQQIKGVSNHYHPGYLFNSLFWLTARKAVLHNCSAQSGSCVGRFKSYSSNHICNTVSSCPLDNTTALFPYRLGAGQAMTYCLINFDYSPGCLYASPAYEVFVNVSEY